MTLLQKENLWKTQKKREENPARSCLYVGYEARMLGRFVGNFKVTPSSLSVAILRHNHENRQRSQFKSASSWLACVWMFDWDGICWKKMKQPKGSWLNFLFHASCQEKKKKTLLVLRPERPHGQVSCSCFRQDILECVPCGQWAVSNQV